jgi:hypothetical protein
MTQVSNIGSEMWSRPIAAAENSSEQRPVSFFALIRYLVFATQAPRWSSQINLSTSPSWLV